MRNLYAFKITLIYFLFGVLWILFSDIFLGALVKDIRILTDLQIVKGWIFILLTSVLLYFLVSRKSSALYKERNKALSSEQALRTILNTQFQLSGLLTPDGTIVFANRSALELIGATEETVLGKPFWDTPWWRDDPAQQNRIRDSIKRAAKGESSKYETHHLDFNGRLHFIEFSIRPVMNEKGKVIYLVPEGSDITEGKKSQNELRKKDIMLENLASQIPGMVYQFLMKPDGSFSVPYSSEGIRDIFGCSPEDVKNDFDAVLKAIFHEDRDKILKSIEESAKNMSQWKCEYRVKVPGESLKWIYGNSIPEKRPDSSIIWSGYNLDITDRVMAEKAIRASEEQLKKSHDSLEKKVKERTAELLEKNKELEEFAYIASHDMQEPLRKIKVFGEMIKNELADKHTEKSLDHLQRMIKGADRMDKLLKALLSYSRVSSKAPALESVDLRSIVRDVINNITSAPDGLEPVIEVGDLPEIKGDPLQMSLLFQNLLTNAIRYHKDGEAPVIKITADIISGEDGGGRNKLCELKIEDNGIGFDMNFKDRIFMPFERLHGRGKYEGTGIGLAICRKIAERHGGQITATGKPGEGAVFTVKLPVK